MTDVPELRDAIESRRIELGLSPGGLAEAAGVTAQGLAPLRAGKRKAYQDRLTIGVCDALAWRRDSIDRLLNGLPPVPLHEPEADTPSDIKQQLGEIGTKLDVVIGALDVLTSELRASIQPPAPSSPQKRGSSVSRRSARA